MRSAVAFRGSSFLARILNTATLVTLLAAPRALHAQAAPAAQKTGDLSAFVLYTRLTPDYGPTNNSGVTFGADYTRYTRWWVNPSIEFRAKIANGSTVNEKTIGGGIRLEKRLHNRFRPYADFLVSKGSIDFVFANPNILPNGQPYLNDATVVYSFGGGLDYDLTPRFAVRGDYQFEKWSLDKNPAAPVHLSPSGWSAGVVYRIQFRRPLLR